MANSTMDFKRFMSPDFQASAQPQMAWMPWDENQNNQNAGSIVDQLKNKIGQGQTYQVGQDLQQMQDGTSLHHRAPGADGLDMGTVDGMSQWNRPINQMELGKAGGGKGSL